MSLLALLKGMDIPRADSDIRRSVARALAEFEETTNAEENNPSSEWQLSRQRTWTSKLLRRHGTKILRLASAQWQRAPSFLIQESGKKSKGMIPTDGRPCDHPVCKCYASIDYKRGGVSKQ